MKTTPNPRRRWRPLKTSMVSNIWHSLDASTGFCTLATKSSTPCKTMSIHESPRQASFPSRSWSTTPFPLSPTKAIDVLSRHWIRTSYDQDPEQTQRLPGPIQSHLCCLCWQLARRRWQRKVHSMSFAGGTRRFDQTYLMGSKSRATINGRIQKQLLFRCDHEDLVNNEGVRAPLHERLMWYTNCTYFGGQ